MSENDDQELSELDVDLRNWNKMQENMKLIGFRDGAIKGKDMSLQEGFNLGYSDGFKLGEFHGMLHGIMRCQSELGLIFREKSEPDYTTYINLLRENCILCSEGKDSVSTQSKQIIPENFNDFLLLQQSHINKIIENIKKPDLELYFENG